MYSCTDCVHYQACSRWVELLNISNDTFNTSTRFINELFNKQMSEVPPVQFPFVDETKEKLCRNYKKRK